MGGKTVMTNQKTIDNFFNQRPIAVIGASRNPKKYGSKLLEALLKRSFEAVPVNPNADHILEQKCFKSIKEN